MAPRRLASRNRTAFCLLDYSLWKRSYSKPSALGLLTTTGLAHSLVFPERLMLVVPGWHFLRWSLRKNRGQLGLELPTHC